MKRSHTPIIADKARRAETFFASAGRGQDRRGGNSRPRRSRLVALMEEIEPQLEPALHDKVTDLLCELTVYDFMQAMLLHSTGAPEERLPRLRIWEGARWAEERGDCPDFRPTKMGLSPSDTEVLEEFHWTNRVKEKAMAGQPKAPFYVVLALVVAGLVAFAYLRIRFAGAPGQAGGRRQDRPRPTGSEGRIGRTPPRPRRRRP